MYIYYDKYWTLHYKKWRMSCCQIHTLSWFKDESKGIENYRLIRKNGPLLREPYSKFISDAIFELRIKQGNDIARVVYFFFAQNKAVLTNGFIKKTQKTPKNVIETAKNIEKTTIGGIKMIKYEDFKNEILKDSTVKAAYDELSCEYDIIQAMIDTRKKLHMTQKELSQITGITQADISRIENGTRNPSLAMLKRLAAGMGMKLKVEFVPIQK